MGNFKVNFHSLCELMYFSSLILARHTDNKEDLAEYLDLCHAVKSIHPFLPDGFYKQRIKDFIKNYENRLQDK